MCVPVVSEDECTPEHTLAWTSCFSCCPKGHGRGKEAWVPRAQLPATVPTACVVLGPLQGLLQAVHRGLPPLAPRGCGGPAASLSEKRSLGESHRAWERGSQRVAPQTTRLLCPSLFGLPA